MKKHYIAVAVFVFVALIIGFLTVLLSYIAALEGSTSTPSATPAPIPPSSPTTSPTSSPTPTTTPSTSNAPTIYTYKIVKTYPHDVNAFTEGLAFDNGVFYESTGEFGGSSLRLVEVESGYVRRESVLPDEFFGEGLTVVNGSLVQLTWMNHVGFVYDKETFDVVRNFSYPTEGWGLTYDGIRLITSDGTSNLTFLDPITFQKVGQVSVHDANTPLRNINELEFVNGDVYANIWLQQKIAIINPQTGQVKGWIDLSGIYQSDDPNAVLNGIAYDSQNNRLFVTGKDWPSLYQITIAPSK